MAKKSNQTNQLLRISDLSAKELKSLLDKAYRSFKAKKIVRRRGAPLPVGLVFAESSTRTRVSFERAARSLGMEPYLLESSSSSLAKGEDLTDTVLNLKALGIENFVVRTASTEQLLALRKLSVGVLNGGDGVGEHPSQALLDLLCLLKHCKGSWKRLLALKLTIVGNLSHSRVANSWIALAQTLGLQLCLVSPKGWAPAQKTPYWTDDLKKGLAGADVVMALRVQNERLSEGGSGVNLEDYIKRYQVDQRLLAGRPLMHPGPINWGVELAETLRDYENSLILDQVRCGLYLRATLLNELIASRQKQS